jgi:hypothetical protein
MPNPLPGICSMTWWVEGGDVPKRERQECSRRFRPRAVRPSRTCLQPTRIELSVGSARAPAFDTSVGDGTKHHDRAPATWLRFPVYDARNALVATREIGS